MQENTQKQKSSSEQPNGHDKAGGKLRRMDPVSLMMGKVPPQAIDMEKAVLGALLLEKGALPRVLDVLRPDMFYNDKHGIIFESILALFQNSEPVDILTVKDHLQKTGKLDQIGGAYYLAELTSRVASSANIEYHARVIAEKAILRMLINISSSTIQDAYDETTDVFSLLDKTEQNLFEVSESNLRRNYSGMPELVMKMIDKLEEMRSSDSSIVGIPSGFQELDKFTSGWQQSDLVIIAARPAMGKTAFTLTVARNAAVQFGVPVAFFSLEMAALQLTQRLICGEAELDAQKVRTGNLEGHEWSQLITRVSSLSKAPIFIDDTPALSVWDLRAKCRRLKAEKGIKIVVIDYLQLMSGPQSKGGNREQEIAAISRALKELAKELDVVVLALSQLSRAVESRGGDKRPMLSDLRESGSIEQDADMVMFLYRPEYYGFETDDEGNSTLGRAEVIISKQRNGPTGTAVLQFVGKYGKFMDTGFDDNMLSGMDPMAAFQNQMENMDESGNSHTITLPSKMNNETPTTDNPPAGGEEEDFDVPF